MASALAIAVLLPLTPALAADYDPPIYVDQAPDYQPVEVGSGWYLRGDVSYLPQKSFRDQDFTFTPASQSESEDAYFASIGFGYHFNDYLRADLNLGYLPGNKF
ncbi:porin family protein, partial [Mesorhizobium sp. M3A.F.Ca.ET.201.01.1.1]